MKGKNLKNADENNCNEEDGKLAFAYTKIDHGLEQGIDHRESIHSRSLQRSNYLIIEQDPRKLKDVKEFAVEAPLNLRYCHP